jgi:hypothetical protein
MLRDLNYFINKFNNIPDNLKVVTDCLELWDEGEIDDFLSILNKDIYIAAFDFVYLSDKIGSEKAAAQLVLKNLKQKMAA